jgi:hypothetical protein
MGEGNSIKDSVTKTKLEVNEKIKGRLLKNALDQDDTIRESQARIIMNNRSITLNAQEIQAHIYYINKSFFELCRTIARTGNKQRASLIASLLFGVSDDGSTAAVDKIVTIGRKLENCGDLTIHKLSFSPLFMNLNDSTVSFLLKKDLTSLEQFPYQPDERLTILYKCLQFEDKA